MQTKLTLRLEEQLIENAKLVAKQSGKSLSQMVADYFVQLHQKPQNNNQPLPPTTASLLGCLPATPSQELDKEDYRDYLESKYQ